MLTWENDQDFMREFSDPRKGLQMFGTVLDQENDVWAKYNPYAITEKLQATLLSYVGDPPYTEDGFCKWLVHLGYRQGGKSLTSELAFYTRAHFTPGWQHVCVADKKDRAEYLFERVFNNHIRWPEEFRCEQLNTTEVRRLSWKHGGRMRVASAQEGGLGIGQSTRSLHGSELPLWDRAARQFNQIFPAMINRRHAMMLLESTPFPMDRPSSDWYRSIYQDAKYGKGRFLAAFFPFWDGKLNRRRWQKGDRLTIEEQRLMDLYYKEDGSGLTEQNIAFRRLMMDTDKEIRRNPDLFRVFYPFDDITCWLEASSSVINGKHLERHLAGRIPWDPDEFGYQEYSPPRTGAQYVIGADSKGYGQDGDSCAFVVLEVWADEWKVVASYQSKADPEDFAAKVFGVGNRYNRALVNPERTGVGHALTSNLKLMGYKNIYHDKHRKPGTHKHSEDYFVSRLIDALIDKLTVVDEDLLGQLSTYRKDRVMRPSEKQEIMGVELPGRRTKDHWDKVSALMMAVVAAEKAPNRHKPIAPKPGEYVLMRDRPLKERLEWEARVRKAQADQRPTKGFRYTKRMTR
jgi:hypothetical protein